MIDISHYNKEENLARTKKLITFYYKAAIVYEAQSGSVQGGENKIVNITELKAVMMTEEKARRFVETGIDWLAPAFGNVYGSYGERGIRLEYKRLKAVNKAVGKDVRLVLYETDRFVEDVYKRCNEGGITKVNINDVLNKRYL